MLSKKNEVKKIILIVKSCTIKMYFRNSKREPIHIASFAPMTDKRNYTFRNSLPFLPLFFHSRRNQKKVGGEKVEQKRKNWINREQNDLHLVTVLLCFKTVSNWRSCRCIIVVQAPSHLQFGSLSLLYIYPQLPVISLLYVIMKLFLLFALCFFFIIPPTPPQC